MIMNMEHAFFNSNRSPRFMLMITTLFALLISQPLQAEKRANKSIVQSKTDYSMVVDGKTYILSDRATVTVDGKKAEFSDVKVGMKVTLNARVLIFGEGDEKNTYEAKRISARTVKEKKKKK